MFGNSKYFSLFVRLHIDKALLTVHGEFIKGNGIEKFIGQSNLSVTSMENTVVIFSDIVRFRYGLQLSDCAIYRQLRKTFSNSTIEVVWEALEKTSKISTIKLYWKNILNLEIRILTFIRAICASNFDSVVKTFDEKVFCS